MTQNAKPASSQTKRSPRLFNWLASLAVVFFMVLFLNLFQNKVPNEISPSIKKMNHSYLIPPGHPVFHKESPGFIALLDSANALVLTGNVGGALEIYDKLLEKKEGKNVLNINPAILHYNMGAYHHAEKHFRLVRCEDFSLVSEEESCFWLKTNGYLAVKELEEAEKSATAALQHRGKYHKDTFNLMRKLIAKR